MSERENLQRDNELLKRVGDDIELTLEDITRARNAEDWAAMELQTRSLEHQCAAYQHLRELDV